MEHVSDRAAYEQMVARTARRPLSAAEIGAELERQTLYHPEPDVRGLDELAAVLGRRFVDGDVHPDESIRDLERTFAHQPLIHLYGFAVRREAGQDAAARRSLDALLALDPGDPMATYFDAFLRSEAVIPASEEVRMANIAKLASTPLLRNPYSLAVGVLFEAIRERRRARVLDIGIGSGAQMEALLTVLGRLPHRIERLEIVALDLMPDFLFGAGQRIAAAAVALHPKLDVVYEPVEGRVEELDASTIQAIAGHGLDAANATIALHEVAGERKLDALSNLQLMRPGRLVLAEWNYCLENVLPETSTEFVFNVRQVAAAMVAALRERYTIEESRAVVRDWLSQGAGQLTCPRERRQECFLDVTTWKALLEACTFSVPSLDPRLTQHAAEPAHATIAEEGWYVKTSSNAGATPIGLLVASPP
jgi:hypothetical protein